MAPDDQETVVSLTSKKKQVTNQERIPAPPSALREGVVAALVSWLEAERAALVVAWAKEGISPTVTLDRLLAYLDMQIELSADRPGHGQMLARLRFETKATEVSRLDIMAATPIVCALNTMVRLVAVAAGSDVFSFWLPH